MKLTGSKGCRASSTVVHTVNVCAAVWVERVPEDFNEELSETSHIKLNSSKTAPAEERREAWRPPLACSCLILNILKGTDHKELTI